MKNQKATKNRPGMPFLNLCAADTGTKKKSAAAAKLKQIMGAFPANLKVMKRAQTFGS